MSLFQDKMYVNIFWNRIYFKIHLFLFFFYNNKTLKLVKNYNYNYIKNLFKNFS